MTPEEQGFLKQVGALGLAGLFAGLGGLLMSRELLTTRIILGRAMSSTTLGIGAAAIITIYPDIPHIAQIGIACLLGSLGTSGLEKIVQRFRG